MEVSHEASELDQIRVCANIGKECTKSNPAKRPCSVQAIIDRLEETESADESSAEQVCLKTASSSKLIIFVSPGDNVSYNWLFKRTNLVCSNLLRG